MSNLNSGISMEYALVKAQARKTDECAQTMISLQQQLETLITGIGQSWQGDAASDFLSKCETLAEKIKLTAWDIQSTAEAIDGAAELFRKAEENAVNIVSNQHYSGGGGGGGGGGGW